MAPTVRRVIAGPSWVDGAVARIVELTDGSGRIETLTPSGWVPETAGGIDGSEVLKGPRASPDKIAAASGNAS